MDGLRCCWSGEFGSSATAGGWLERNNQKGKNLLQVVGCSILHWSMVNVRVVNRDRRAVVMMLGPVG